MRHLIATKYIAILRKIFAHSEHYGKEEQALLRAETVRFWEEVSYKKRIGKGKEALDMIRQVRDCLKEFAPRFGKSHPEIERDLLPVQKPSEKPLSPFRRAKRIDRMKRWKEA